MMNKSNNECLNMIAESLAGITKGSALFLREKLLEELGKVRLKDETDPDRVVRRIIDEVMR